MRDVTQPGPAHRDAAAAGQDGPQQARNVEPEAGGGGVNDLVFEHNRQQNLQRLGVDEGSFLLPQTNASGGPTHPSFPPGHAVSAGACVTVLKAWFDGNAEFPDPVVPSADGTEIIPYEGPPLTIDGELDKLCHNLSWGRDMSGVHSRTDNDGGNLIGENVAIRILKEDRLTYPERFDGFTLHRFDGTTIPI